MSSTLSDLINFENAVNDFERITDRRISPKELCQIHEQYISLRESYFLKKNSKNQRFIKFF